MFRRSTDMTLSRAEFLRLLPLALAAYPHAVDGEFIRGRNWHIRLTPLDDLRYGEWVRLPRHRVEIEFSDAFSGVPETFLQRFDLYYRRGGG